MRYEDFVNLNYSPTNDDLICEFIVEPEGVSLKEAAGAIAAESSIGTWTELSTMRSYVTDLHATVFKIDGETIGIAYPAELFEYGNMPNILSSIRRKVSGRTSPHEAQMSLRMKVDPCWR